MDKAVRKIRTLIVDDEPLARQTISLLLNKDSDVEVIGECANAYEAMKSIKDQAPDLVFLDIQLPGLNGFDLLEDIRIDQVPAIIFVTAFDQYAISAFEVQALDYLLKPFTDKRFEKALVRAKAEIKQREVCELSQKLIALIADNKATEKLPEPVNRQSNQYLTRLLIRSIGRVFFLKVDEIDWIEADNYYVQLHVGRKSHLLRETMNELEHRLDPEKFLRIHRSTIVNMDRIIEMQPHLNGDYLVILHNGTQLKLSRSRREQIQTKLKLNRK